MSKKTYKVEFNGQTFKRTTAREYKFLVVAKPSFDYEMECALKATDYNFDYLVSCYQGTCPEYVKRQDKNFEETVAKGKAMFEMGQKAADKQYSDRRVAGVMNRKAEGYFDSFQFMGWTSRLDLAQKLHGKIGYCDFKTLDVQ
jgi:hypothetical protein